MSEAFVNVRDAGFIKTPPASRATEEIAPAETKASNEGAPVPRFVVSACANSKEKFEKKESHRPKTQ